MNPRPALHRAGIAITAAARALRRALRHRRDREPPPRPQPRQRAVWRPDAATTLPDTAPWTRTPDTAAARAAIPPRRNSGDYTGAVHPHGLDFQAAPAHEPVQPPQGRLIDQYPTASGFIELGPNADQDRIR